MNFVRPHRADFLIAAGVLAAAVLEVIANPHLVPKTAAVPLECAMGVAIAWRRVAAFWVTFVVSVLLTVEAIAGVPLQEPLVPLLSLLLAVYAVGAYRSTRVALAGLAAVVAGIGVQTTVQHKGIGNLAFGLVFGAGTWLTGRVVRTRTHENAALTAHAAQVALDSEVRVAVAAADERARISRELHDVISHSVSVMVVQAGAAEQVSFVDAERAREAMRTVQSTGRQALSELAHLLGMLRENGEEIGLAPQPGLGELPALVSSASHASLSVVGTERPVPPGVALSVYRVVQEALTNVRKHAPGATVVVSLCYLPTAVEVRIVDDGAGRPEAVAVGGGGHGIIGMKERVSVYGGTLQAGPRADGGYTVCANFPLEVTS